MAETVFADREEALALVGQSPLAVAAQDREAWLGLFSRLAVIEDPVGSTPHVSSVYDRRSGCRGDHVLQRFYDCFIAGNRVEFRVERDFVVGDQVMRDLALELEVEGMKARVPMHLLYSLVREEGALKVQRLAAHWEFLPVSRQMVSSSVGGIGRYSMRLIRYLGLRGVLGFSRAAFNVGDWGKALARRFLEAGSHGQASDLEALFDPDARGIVLPGRGRAIPPADFPALQMQVQATKFIAAGNCVSCSLLVGRGDEARPGVALFEINTRTRRLDRVQLFFEA